MALWMEEGSEPMTESQRADIDALTALKESAAVELKEKGNQYVKMGKKYYKDAIDCYTRAINQVSNDSENSIIFANRAHVNLLLGNYRHALTDADEAIKLCPTNVKALYRAAKAAISLDLLSEASLFCQTGLEQYPDNDELKKLTMQIDLRKSEHKKREAQVLEAVAAAKDIALAIENRELKLGKATYQELIGVRKPTLDKSNILHWPVLLLYAEVMSSDFIEDFCEIDMFSVHLDMMYSDNCPPLPWDTERTYTRDSVELYYEADSGSPLSKREIIEQLLEGTSGSMTEGICDEESNINDCSGHAISSSKIDIPNIYDTLTPGTYATCLGRDSVKWVKVNEKKTLHDILRQPHCIIPGIPVFYVVSKWSSFYKAFKAGKWAPP